MHDSVYTRQDEIDDVSVKRPHLVILGAGASVAALPNGDKNGLQLPIMKNFVEVLALHDDLRQFSIEYKDRNFEELYASIHENKEYEALLKVLEKKIHNYFEQLELPETPTIYDLLVLGLREKDIIATFNWDPFLFQALKRNFHRLRGKPPRAIYLHGNVAIGFTKSHLSMGPVGGYSQKTGELFEPTKLLYPISQKNYSENIFISKMWQEMNVALRKAFMVTVFGYGAPESDIEAIDLLKNGWGDVDSRSLEEIEIIDLKTEDELLQVWEPFIHTHHCSVKTKFEESHIFLHPRRSIEALQAGILGSRFTVENPFLETNRFEDLENHLSDLLNAESEFLPE